MQEVYSLSDRYLPYPRCVETILCFGRVIASKAKIFATSKKICDKTKIYRSRHIIERLFGRLKENKRIAMRFDKLDSTFFSFIALALAKLYKLFC